ncbi:restriction endonuclease subunit S [Bacillus sp. ISL-57]|uniref:restriction endonuclease subunit S n=1 Tax=Bacillus sp. ISL-57 TaxID=2819135 RepID=UPI001BE7D4B0|nr:restriction endonuclease subunit S [Bacillus sp. ISL-57]MBT2715421.1 restriction endonuclease subunit S [Bacillus sp. ISL-57]
MGKDREKWNTYQFSEVCNVNPNYKFERNKEYSYVEMAAVSQSSPKLKYIQKKEHTGQGGSKFRNGDVLFARITPCTQNGKTAHVTDLETEYGFGSTELIVLSPKEEMLLDKYLYYFVKDNKVRNRAIARMVGTTGRQRVPNEFFKEELEIDLPSIQEQQKIASILSSVDEAIEKTEVIIEQTEEVKKGLMQQLLTKGIGHKKFKKTEVGEIPLDWEVVKIIDIAENEKNAVKPGPFGSSLKKEFYVKSGYKVYGQEQVIANDFKIGEYYIDDKKYEELNAFKVKPFDLLISLVGTFGKIAVVPERKFKPGIINPRLLKITFDKSKANVHYYKYYMSSSSFYQQLEGMSQGGTMGVINGKILKSIHFPLPSLDEQQRIVNILTNIDQKLDIETRKCGQLQILKKGLMQSLLTGKVRVKVDEAEVTQV